MENKSLEVKYTPARIDADFSALKERVSNMVKDYENATYDVTNADELKQAKRDRAYLNSIVKEIDERRKIVKREYTKPLNAFEDKCREVSSIAKDLSDNIKTQIDKGEELRLAARFDELKTFYEDYAELLAPVVSFETLCEHDWLLKSTNIEKAKDAICEKVQKIAQDWNVLKAQKQNIRCYDVCERTFFQTLDLGKALNSAALAEKQQERIKKLNQVTSSQTETLYDYHFTLIEVTRKTVEEVSKALNELGVEFEIERY